VYVRYVTFSVESIVVYHYELTSGVGS